MTASEALGLLAVAAFLAVFLAFAKTLKHGREAGIAGGLGKLAGLYLKNWLVWTAVLAAFPAAFILIFCAGVFIAVWRPTF